MNALELNGQTIELDKDGYLKELSLWTPAVADALAHSVDITLTDAHWEVLDALREFYRTFELAPSMRPLCKHLKATLGEEKGTSLYLMGLFPESPALVAAKIAGLPRPTNCF